VYQARTAIVNVHRTLFTQCGKFYCGIKQSNKTSLMNL